MHRAFVEPEDLPIVASTQCSGARVCDCKRLRVCWLGFGRRTSERVGSHMDGGDGGYALADFRDIIILQIAACPVTT